MTMSEVFTAKEIAKIADLEASYIRRLLGQGVFPNAVKRAGGWFVPQDDLDRWLAERKAKKRKREKTTD